MTYMIYQQYTTAIKAAYADHPDVAQHAAAARTCRQWLESLEIDPQLRTALVEQIRALEEAFKDLMKLGQVSDLPLGDLFLQSSFLFFVQPRQILNFRAGV